MGALPPNGLGVKAEAAISRGLVGFTAMCGSLSCSDSLLRDWGIMLTTWIIPSASYSRSNCSSQSRPRTQPVLPTISYPGAVSVYGRVALGADSLEGREQHTLLSATP